MDFLSLLHRSPLFEGIEGSQIIRLCTLFDSYTKEYPVGSYLWMSGDEVQAAGIVLRGEVQAEKISRDGSFQIMARHMVGSLFGDVLMSSQTARSPFDIKAAEDTTVLFLPIKNMMREGGGDCAEALGRFRMNLLGEISDNYWDLHRKLAYLSAPSLRAKLALWLEHHRQADGSVMVEMPREQLAALLGANRSALSRELSRMEKEGILRLSRRRIQITDAEALEQYLP